MIAGLRKFSLFIGQGELNQYSRKYRLESVYRKKWVRVVESGSITEGHAILDCANFSRYQGVATLLGLEVDELERIVIGITAERKDLIGVRLLDGVLLHPVGIAKAVERLIRALKRSKNLDRIRKKYKTPVR